ncbi:30S ribosomal protein S6 [Cryobacterium sp. 10I1]|jgi:small subunit ribosomal protein S6|uniref:Small ribosomal subunit protein bS6 n=1 Tax=Cryobacterium glucosi TaxID=1259175 RepID=A0ABY2IRX8_9MICO|nr:MULTISPECIES: 30S ribosomal protein S6 [Cryobacterium]MEA9999071.1 30S ribosomal protein S6 [Cryobacterium sp. RTS3]MEB0001549.1 30S ribosomal protein S6 [Cryobacterium sp. RTC2.1]MEB0202102.1 30S ribosomal protein S6 [Cryobacterium sp. 5I3]MEB0286076.1 30S ribosomal protein S6 [Cryobacterium sp. 10S3]MEB0289557.1 30S ribosomal protein S6 [Cryobacterium sp. 10C2]MEB0303995.1 30S ribosomal protein S6 [Cryobacterium sp. 10I1]
MHQYELMVILDPEIDERTVAPSLDKFLNVVRNDGGTIDKVDVWGRRRLAYEINKKSEGIYAVVDFTANASATAELDRQLKLSEAVMRTKVLRAEEGIAQVAVASKLAAEKAARKAANPKVIAAKAEAAAAPTAKVAASVKPASAPAAAAVKAAAPAAPAAPAAVATPAAVAKPAAVATPAPAAAVDTADKASDK